MDSALLRVQFPPACSAPAAAAAVVAAAASLSASDKALWTQMVTEFLSLKMTFANGAMKFPYGHGENAYAMQQLAAVSRLSAQGAAVGSSVGAGGGMLRVVYRHSATLNHSCRPNALAVVSSAYCIEVRAIFTFHYCIYALHLPVRVDGTPLANTACNSQFLWFVIYA
jgi:hypothetical protein